MSDSWTEFVWTGITGRRHSHVTNNWTSIQSDEVRNNRQLDILGELYVCFDGIPDGDDLIKNTWKEMRHPPPFNRSGVHQTVERNCVVFLSSTAEYRVHESQGKIFHDIFHDNLD